MSLLTQEKTKDLEIKANLIRESKTPQIYSAIQMGANQGMQTLESALAALVKGGLISYQEALAKTSRTEDFNRMVGPAALV